MRISAANFKFAVCVIVVGAGVSAALWRTELPALAAEPMRQVASTIAQIAATMMGFLFAALAILASIANMRLLRNLQRTGNFQVLLGRMLIAATAFFFLMIFAIVVMVSPSFLSHELAMGIGLLIASCFALVDATMKFAVVLFSLKPLTKPLE
jgi:hypothetical protein